MLDRSRLNFNFPGQPGGRDEPPLPFSHHWVKEVFIKNDGNFSQMAPPHPPFGKSLSQQKEAILWTILCDLGSFKGCFRKTKILGLRRPRPHVGENSKIIPYFFYEPFPQSTINMLWLEMSLLHYCVVPCTDKCRNRFHFWKLKVQAGRKVGAQWAGASWWPHQCEGHNWLRGSSSSLKDQWVGSRPQMWS